MTAPAKYAAMARKSASRGSFRFVYNSTWDDREPWPNHFGRQGDNPFKNSYGWLKFRWLVHDVRIYGFRESFRRWYYLLDTWRNRGERIFAGEDENGNRYWFSHMGKGLTMGLRGGRFIEPKDPHVLRGQDAHTPPPKWLLWLVGNSAHTPAMMQARGEWGIHGRQWGGGVWSVRHKLDHLHQGNDPTWLPTNSLLVSPWYKLIKESGFAHFSYNSNPAHFPFAGEHDVKQEVVEDFYRHNAPHARWSRGHDHDEWRN